MNESRVPSHRGIPSQSQHLTFTRLQFVVRTSDVLTIKPTDYNHRKKILYILPEDR